MSLRRRSGSSASGSEGRSARNAARSGARSAPGRAHSDMRSARSARRTEGRASLDDARSFSARGSARRGRPSSGGQVRRSQMASSRTRAAASPVVRRSNSRPVAPGAAASSRFAGAQGDDLRDGRRDGLGTRPDPSTRHAASLRSSSVASVNARRERAVRGVRRSRTPRIVAMVLVALTVAVGGGLFALYHSSLFSIKAVTVSGVSHLTADELTRTADIPAGATLINVDAAGVESRLEANPWVKDATVERLFPDTVNLAVSERAITAVVDVQVDDSANRETWALSSDGMWLMAIPARDSQEGAALAPQVYEDVDRALKITDVPYGSTPEAGTFCNNANVNNALSIISGMSTELADQVVTVAASNPESTTLTLSNGVEVAFGDSSDIRDKERVVLQIMEEHPGTVAYVNVRTPSKPIWRSL